MNKRSYSQDSNRWLHASIKTVSICFALLVAVHIEACYYVQAVNGHMDVMNRRKPVDEVMVDPNLDDGLKDRLGMAQEARTFAVDELLLPDNDSYRSYADLEREYVVWNVFAAPEFSLTPKRWCYPVAGCVAYRGYFAEDSARKESEKLTGKGFDTSVGGVAAYSTLGRFDDPLLNTMMRWRDVELVSTLFHELAHQKLYIKGDTEFNESFATAVADVGLQRWLAGRDQAAELAEYQARRALRSDIMTLAVQTKKDLAELYSQDMDDENKRSEKQKILDTLSHGAGLLIESSKLQMTNWLAAPLNNARLVPLGLYEGNLEAFRTLMRQCDDDLACFYGKADGLAAMSMEERAQKMSALHPD